MWIRYDKEVVSKQTVHYVRVIVQGNGDGVRCSSDCETSICRQNQRPQPGLTTCKLYYILLRMGLDHPRCINIIVNTEPHLTDWWRSYDDGFYRENPIECGKLSINSKNNLWLS